MHGFLGAFERIAATNAAMLQDLAATGVELVGLDPSMTLTYRSEYAGALDASRLPKVLLVQEWLARHRDALPSGGRRARTSFCRIARSAPRRSPPCATGPTVFAAFGLRLTILPSGCCGMAGTWGHEAEHRATSEHIYSLSWAQHVAGAGRSGTLLADGYSCRSQAKCIDGVMLLHPLQALLSAVRNPTAMAAPPEASLNTADTAGLHQTPLDAEAAQMG